MIHSDRDPSKHQEEQADPAIPFSGTSYAKDCIPWENICNVTVVTKGGSFEPTHIATLQPAESAPPTTTDKSWPQTKFRQKPAPRSARPSAAERTAHNRSNRPRRKAK